MNNWEFALRALRARNYRLFFSGQSVSVIGTWMTRVATAWLVYRLTKSAVLLGIVSFSGQVPAFFLAPIAGVWIDRWDRRRTLVVTQVLSMLQSFALAALALAGVIQVWEVIVLALVQGIINAFDMPARQSFVIQMVERREDLGNAIALNSSMVNMARLIGPAVAGFLISVAGEGYCFLADGLSYIAVVASLLMMRMRVAETRPERRDIWPDLVEGWRYVSGSPPIRLILLLLGLVSLVAMPYTVLMPIFASAILHGGPHTLGYLTSAAGLGALTGAISLAMRRSVVGLGSRIAVASALFGASLIVFALSRYLWLSLLILPLTGFAMMQQMAASNTILQTIVEDGKRGRVMSFYAMAFQGMAPFGSLLAGTMASRIGAPATLVMGGSLCIGGSALFAHRLPALRKLVRPIYERLGILPEVAMAVHNTSEMQTPPQT